MVLIVLLLAFIGITIVAIVSPMQYSSAGQQDEFKFPEITGNGSDGFVAHSQTTASIPAMTGIELKSGQLEQDAQLYNPDTNPCAFVVSLYLGNGTLLFQTNPIYPGDSVSTVVLTQALNSGKYRDAVLVYDCYSSDGTLIPLTRCEFVVEINSK